MKFIEAVKAMGPGQLLVNPAGAKLELRDGVLWIMGMSYPPDRVLYQDKDGWHVIDKPRPRVKFAEAMRAALNGKAIESCGQKSRYKFHDGTLVFDDDESEIAWIDREENKGDWEIIEAEDGK